MRANSSQLYSPANKRKSVADDLARLDLWPKDERTIGKYDFPLLVLFDQFKHCIINEN
jgi:hypothetical protein